MAAAVLLMAVAMTMIPLGDTAGKLLIQQHGMAPVFVAWARFALGTALAAAIVFGSGAGLAPLRDWRSSLRGAFIVGTIVCMLTAVATEPIATVFAAFFIGPLLSYLLSVLFLGESVGPRRTVLLVLGFAGVLLAVRPGFGMTPGLGFAVLAGVFYGCYLTASRWLSGRGSPQTLLLAQLALGFVVLGPPGLAAWPEGDWAWGPLAVSGGASFLGNLLLLAAYRLMPATRLAPFIYFQLVAATAMGAAVFGEWPDGPTLAGIGLLLATGFASLALRRDR